MQLIRLSLRNWCQHACLDLLFGPGLTGVTGHNGAGKSNAVQKALTFAITGKTDGSGTIKDNLRWGSSSGYVELEFQHGTDTYVARRNIHSSGVQLQLPDGSTLKKAGEVDAYLETLLETNKAALLENVLVPQGQLDSVFSTAPSARLKEFQRVFGLMNVEDINKLCLKEIATHQVDLTLEPRLAQLVADRGQALDDLAQASALVEPLRAEIRELELSSSAVLQQYQTALAASRAVETLQQSKARAEQDRAKAAQELQDAHAVCAAAREAANFVEQIPELEQQLQDASTALAAWEAHRSAQTRVTQAQSVLDQLPKVAVAQVSEAYDALQQLLAAQYKTQAILADVQNGNYQPYFPEGKKNLPAQLSDARTQLQQVKATNSPVDPQTQVLAMQEKHLRDHAGIYATGTCPTCGQAVNPDEGRRLIAEADALRDRRQQLAHAAQESYTAAVAAAEQHLATVEAEYKKAVADLSVAVQESLKVRVERVRAAQATHAALTEQATAWQKQEALVAGLHQAATAPAVECPAPTAVEDLRTRIAHYRQAQRTLHTAMERLTAASRALDGAEERLFQTQTQLDDLSRNLPQMPTDSEIETAKRNQEIVSVRRQTLQDAEIRLATARNLLAQYDVATKTLTEQLHQQARAQEWVKLMTRIRDLTKVTEFPALAMRTYVGYINERLSYYLELWEAPFEFWLSDSLEFQARKADGPAIDASRLSGGERVVAALTFRLAMSDLFSRGVDFLVLDEPSAYLDNDNIQHLQHVMLQLKVVAGQAGKQVLVVTHEQTLMGCFDSIIQIGKVQTVET